MGRFACAWLIFFVVFKICFPSKHKRIKVSVLDSLGFKLHSRVWDSKFNVKTLSFTLCPFKTHPQSLVSLLIGWVLSNMDWAGVISDVTKSVKPWWNSSDYLKRKEKQLKWIEMLIWLLYTIYFTNDFCKANNLGLSSLGIINSSVDGKICGSKTWQRKALCPQGLDVF